QPANLLRGEQSATTLRVKSVSLSLSANGNLSSGPHAQFVGRVVASAPSLRHVGRLANIAIPLPGLLGDTSLAGDATVADNGFSLLMKAGRLELALAEAKAYRGLFKARLSAVGAGSNALDLRGNAQLANMDAASLAWDLLDRPRISGTLNASVSMEAAGDSVLQTIRNLDGKGQFSLTQGEIGGIDVNEALRRIATRPLSSLNEMRGGRTVLDKAV